MDLNVNIKKIVRDQKVLLQYSGGKDSTGCLIALSKLGVDFEAIHFTHKYSYDLTIQTVKEICNHFNVPLHCVDITEKIKEIFLNDFRQRPCRFCKSLIDGLTVEFAGKNQFGIICIGDNADDTMLINRIKNNHEDPEYSRYFNQKVTLPEKISIVRPLIYIKSTDILSFVLANYPSFKRINDTGDKYFEYSREGCPLQFKDFGIPYTLDLMNDLKKYNQLCSSFASEMGIKASIHLPSQFIVTIPKGYENACIQYLENHGFCYNRRQKNTNFEGVAFNIDISLNCNIGIELTEIALQRFVERMSLNYHQSYILENSIIILGKEIRLISTVFPKKETMNIQILSKRNLDLHLLENICIEIFHTYSFKISKIFLQEDEQ